MVNIGDSITISIIVIGLYFHKLKSNYKIILEVLNMEYGNNYINEKHNIMWNIATYIRRRYSVKVGNVLLNTFC